jgi:trimeric autotransporter adhesin
MNRMKTLLGILMLLLALSSNAQTWKFIGSSTGIGDGTEVDMEISSTGTIFIAYIDVLNSNKITVKKWNEPSQAWQTVGTAGIGDANVTGLQLTVMSNDYPAIAARTTYLGVDFIEIYKFNGTAWVYQPIGSGGYNETDHNYGFSLKASGTNLFLTFYNADEQSSGYSQLGLITVNMTNQTVYGGASANLEQTNASGTLSSCIEGNNAYVIHNEIDNSDYMPLDVSINGAAYSNFTLNGSNNASKMKIDKGSSSTLYNTFWLDKYTPFNLVFRSFNGTAMGTELAVTTTQVIDFDFDNYGNEAYVFYKSSSSCFYKKVATPMTPSISTISSGTALAPANSTSLCTEVYQNIKVIAYISSGKVYVKEQDGAANIEDFDLFQFCEGTAFNNNGDVAVINLDPNYSHSNLSMTCVSQNTAIIPQSNVSITGNGLNYYLTISGTNGVSSTTTVDLLWTLLENNISIGTLYTPVTIFANPSIAFNIPGNEVCENENPVFLVGKATPLGGTWFGPGISGNFFYPNYFSPAPSTSSYVHYAKTSAQGCTAVDSVLITINQVPDLVVSTFDADCNQANGSASVSITGGAPAYDIYWSNGSTISSTTNLLPGQYYVNVTDNNGCSSVAVAAIGSSGITLSANVTNVTCFGETNGGINLSVNGTNGPFTYAWSNGATTQDLQNIAAGPYEVIVTDNSGCVSTASYTVLQPAAIVLNSHTETAPSCSASNGTITVNYIGGTQPFTYSWENALGNSIGTNASTLSGLNAGYYTSIVTDNVGCVYQEEIALSNTNGPVIAIDTIIASDCSNNGSVAIIDVSNNVVSYEWSNGATTQNLSNIGTGEYTVEATAANGCVSVLSAEVDATLPIAATVCLVTVDTSTNTNLVVWEKPLTNGIDHFNVYRETSQAGLYQIIAQVPYTDESIYNDLVASPSVRSWRYKISSVDACGVESEISEHHKTIHLVINHGLGTDYNLSWDSYEGFSYSSFEIYRYTTLDGWNLIATMPTNLFTYTDTPLSEDELTYIVVVDAPQICSTTKAQDFNTTRSNKDRAGLSAPADLSEMIEQQFEIYPVPSSGEINISNRSNSAATVELLDETGRIIEAFTVQTGIQTKNFQALANGVYYLNIQQNEVIARKQIIIQH